MNHARFATLAVAVLALTLPSSKASATAAPSATPAAACQESAGDGAAALGLTHSAKSTEVKLSVYRPRVLHPEELQNLAGELFGEQLDVEIWQGDKVVNIVGVAHFMTFGSNLMIRDTTARTTEIAGLLQELEEAEAQRRAQEQDEVRRQEEDAMAQQRAAELEFQRMHESQREKYERMEVRPRFVSLQSLRQALSAFERAIASGPQGEDLNNFTEVEQANVLLIEDTAAQIERMEQLVALIDRPQAQVQVTAYVLKVAADGGSSGIPGDLVSALAGMNLGSNFRLLSTGTLRSAIQAQRYCELGNAEPNGATWKLRFLPVACDQASGQVTLQDCAFETESVGASTLGGNQPGSTQHFQTNVTIGLDEWVVLGSVGSQPTLVALRIAFTTPRKAKPN